MFFFATLVRPMPLLPPLLRLFFFAFLLWRRYFSVISLLMLMPIAPFMMLAADIYAAELIFAA